MSNDNSKSTKFRNLAEKNVAPVFLKVQEVTVSFLNEGSLIDKYAEIEYSAIEYAYQPSPMPFTKEEFKNYCLNLVLSRIQYVLNKKPLVYPTDHIMVPSFLMNIIMQIGIAQDLKLGISVKPAEPDSVPAVAIEKMREISFYLEALKGYEGGFGYPRDKAGSWDLMTMQLIGNEIQRFDAEAHPVYALMASVIGPKLIESVLSPLVKYGDSTLFEGLLWQLTSI